MKLAVLSDIHGNLPALQAVLEEVEREHVDEIINLGDILSGPLLPAETADYLMARRFPTIAGNHERQLLQLLDRSPAHRDATTSDGYAAGCISTAQADWLRTLPATLWLEDDVLLVHGTPGTDLQYWLETVAANAGPTGIRIASEAEVAQRLASAPGAQRATLALCGHSHVPRVVQSGGTLVVNPGSVGLQAYHDDHVAPHVVENGSPQASYAVVERRRGGWHAQLRSVPYEWQPMARLARERGRADWAYALATGRQPAPLATIRP